MTSTYAKAYTEVLEILNHLSEDEYNKIPKEKIEFYKSNMATDYNYSFDENVSLSNQNMSREASSIIVQLFRDYFATPEQKEKLEKILKQNEEKNNQYAREKYNPEKVFGNKKVNVEHSVETMELIEYKEPFFTKVISKIKLFFRRIMNS